MRCEPIVGTVLIVALLAGCAGPADRPLPDLAFLKPTTDCPTLPDGTTMDCESTILEALEVHEETPTVLDGWFCTIDHDDEAPQEWYRLWATPDRDMGWSWRWPFNDTGHSYAAIALFEPGRTQYHLFPYTYQGFVEYPEPAQGQEGEAQFNLFHFALSYFDGERWIEAADAKLRSALYNDTGYFVWTWDSPWGPMTIDLMDANDVPFQADHEPTSRLFQVGDSYVSAGVAHVQINFEGQFWPFTRTLMGGDCLQQSLPGGGP